MIDKLYADIESLRDKALANAIKYPEYLDNSYHAHAIAYDAILHRIHELKRQAEFERQSLDNFHPSVV